MARAQGEGAHNGVFLDFCPGIQSQRDDVRDTRPHLVVQRTPHLGGVGQFIVAGQPRLDVVGRVAQAAHQPIPRQNGEAKEGQQATAQQAVFVLGIGGPSRQHVKAIHPHRGALATITVVAAVSIGDLFPLVLAQDVVLAQVVEEEIDRRLCPLGAILALGLFKADLDLVVLDRQFLFEQLADGLV